MIIDTVKILGSLFYNKHKKDELQALTLALIDINALSEYCIKSLYLQTDELIESSFLTLFEGDGQMPAPPWGSVYLDKEKVIFGTSTIEYRLFLSQHDIELDTGLREPEDQFGLMLFAYAQLLSENKQSAAKDLMEYHFLPWGIVYLERLHTQTDNLYFQALAHDVKIWLLQLAKNQQYTIQPRKIHSHE
ncbi:dimethylsulfoxide reductase [Vibrio sp. 10N.286.49.B3]|uniref:molecular chaperone TorD family protein n=1 Tax=Vibrio sp. 10N.286.49.B3 TaxID=1880855 RepID=UPI000C83C1F8|nr:molecular chaperone TorD family protein [Vibrio sp. 10N.286.49.B3]PMH43860.1 dimethylsulfoxide reductase [Vibrio sp. 10N.286.49.B3]